MRVPRCGDWSVGNGEQFRTAGAWLASRMKNILEYGDKMVCAFDCVRYDGLLW